MYGPVGKVLLPDPYFELNPSISRGSLGSQFKAPSSSSKICRQLLHNNTTQKLALVFSELDSAPLLLLEAGLCH